MTTPEGAPPGTALDLTDVQEAWRVLSPEERSEAFRELSRLDAEEFLLELPTRDQAQLIAAMSPAERRSWLRLLPPDDVADLLQEVPAEERDALLAQLDDATRHQVTALLAYAEDDAGGLMNPRYVRLRPEMKVDEAIRYLRQQLLDRPETVSYLYVLDPEQRLLGIVSLRDLLSAQPDKTVRDSMRTDVVTVPEGMDQEALSRLFAQHDLIAIPVVDARGVMKGVVTVDDIVDVVQEEATEDIQKIGGSQALGAPYLDVGVVEMVRRRGGWLAVLFLGEMITASAMARYEHAIASAVVLALFVPLIISSGGNSGSQATTLVIRAMALGELQLSDWWRVVRRELAVGAALGLVLGVFGFLRVVLWEVLFHTYGVTYVRMAFTVFASVLGVVAFGTLMGSTLPFLLRRFGLDPASASAPFVATLVDVTGIVIYFTVASWILVGLL